MEMDAWKWMHPHLLPLTTCQFLGVSSANNPCLLVDLSLLQHRLLAPTHTSVVEQVPHLAQTLQSLPHQKTSNSHPEIKDLKFTSYQHIPQHKSSSQIQLY